MDSGVETGGAVGVAFGLRVARFFVAVLRAVVFRAVFLAPAFRVPFFAAALRTPRFFVAVLRAVVLRATLRAPVFLRAPLRAVFFALAFFFAPAFFDADLRAPFLAAVFLAGLRLVVALAIIGPLDPNCRNTIDRQLALLA
jgi:hypothetical protein